MLCNVTSKVKKYHFPQIKIKLYIVKTTMRMISNSVHIGDICILVGARVRNFNTCSTRNVLTTSCAVD